MRDLGLGLGLGLALGLMTLFMEICFTLCHLIDLEFNHLPHKHPENKIKIRV